MNLGRKRSIRLRPLGYHMETRQGRSSRSSLPLTVFHGFATYAVDDSPFGTL